MGQSSPQSKYCRDLSAEAKWPPDIHTHTQIQSLTHTHAHNTHYNIMLVVAFGWCTPGLKDHLLFKCGQFNIALLYHYRMIILH